MNRKCSTPTPPIPTVATETLKWKYTGCATHLEPLLSPQRRTQVIKDLTDLMTPFKKEFGAVAVCGVSGMLAGIPIALALQKRLLIVRKDGETSHSCYKVEGAEYESTMQGDRAYARHKVAIIDDLIDSGKTMNHIIERLSTADGPATARRSTEHEVVAIFLYNPLGCGGQSTFDWKGGEIPVHTL